MRRGRRGRGAYGKTLVPFATEIRGVAIRRIRLVVIPDATASTLVDAVAELVEPGSGVVTDAWAGYASLPKRGFNHTVSRGGAPNVGGNLLPHVHRVAALLKRWLLGTHQGAIRREHLQAYLDEFVFRFNRRTASSRALLFRGLLEQALNHPPVTLPRLIGKA